MDFHKQENKPWHALHLPDVLAALNSTDGGLTEDEAASRLNEYGPNRLPEKPPTAPWKFVLRQFASPLIYILGVAAVVSVFIGDVKDAGFILAVLVINAAIGSYQEWKAERSSDALKKLLKIQAAVSRGNDVRDLTAEDLVPGDVVWLESGNRVPADLRLLSAHGLEIDESLLTGESLPSTKDPAAIGAGNDPVGDRLCMAFAGSTVTLGRAKGIVVATGIATHVGQIALDVVASDGGKPPLIGRMERFTKAIAVVTLVLAVLTGGLGVLLGGLPPAEMFLFAVALAVSVIPEGLPVAMTVALAIAVTRMSKRGVIVRKLTAVEGLGSCTLIATDKTGTLTVNELTVREIRLVSGETLGTTGEGFIPEGEILFGGEPVVHGKLAGLDDLAMSGILCNEAILHHRDGTWEWRGDAVDIALLCLGHKIGLLKESSLDAHPQINDIPFEPERQYAATFNSVDGGVKSFVKGAPERVLAMCEDTSRSRELENQAIEMASRGLRVIAIASGNVNGGMDSSTTPAEPENLTFLGFVGMLDPLRSGAREAICAARGAGVSVTMITGDHRATALAIARELDLAETEEQVLTGPEMIGKTDAELEALIAEVRVFARVAPRQKLEIVEAARRAGQFVAVTGDGVNDAPALRNANIGVAMGKSGTDVAREAADMVISDDDFTTIVAGIEEGRIAYDNIRKVIFLLISTGAAELVLMGLAITTGLPLPLLPVQILWLNLVTNGIQDVALAFEPGEGDVLKRKPRTPGEPVFNRLMIERTVVSALVFGGIGFGAFHWMIREDWATADARNALLLMMVLFENFHIGNCRSETRSAFLISPFRSPLLLAAAASAFLIHVMAMHVPFMQGMLGTAPVSLSSWAVLAALALLIVPTMELHKWWWNRRCNG